MKEIRLDSKDGLANGWMGAGFGAGVADASNVPERSRKSASPSRAHDEDAPDAPKRKGLINSALRFARNALIGLAVIAAVPFATVAFKSQSIYWNGFTRARELTIDLERLRSLSAPTVASITPLEAGLAFHALQGPSTVTQFPSRPIEHPLERPWQLHKADAGLFTSTTNVFVGPAPDQIIRQAKDGFSATQLAWLRTVAEAPLWKDFDLVASARAVDMIGGQYELPFRADAFSLSMPISRFAGTKELAYASMSRAAYYVSIGEVDRAEAALRSVVSFGFAMVDNSTTLVDVLLGRVIVSIGRNGVEQFNAVTGGRIPLNYTPPNIDAEKVLANKLSVSEQRRRLLAEIADPALPRGMRFERMSELSLSSCGNIPEMVLGPNAETRATFDAAKKSLARFPSEAAYIDLMLSATNRLPEDAVPSGIGRKLIVGAAAVTAIVTNNPRIDACTRMATFYR